MKTKLKMSGYLPLKSLAEIALGLNIEGMRPTKYLPPDCAWYNLVQVLDRPLLGDTFDQIKELTEKKSYQLLEQAVDIYIENMFATMVDLVRQVTLQHSRVLVHVHQYTGSTILDEILAEKTGCKVILDRTNFAEFPVDYQKEYPEIDALISISQCAGFGLPVGAWVVPDSFRKFDVQNSIIYSQRKAAPNKLLLNSKFLSKYNCHIGPLVYVDDLWNPNTEQLESSGVLLLDEADNEVLEFVKENTKMFDESHDWRHAARVAYNATQILNSKDVLYLALLHDVCDHKYSDALPQEALDQWIIDNLPDYRQLVDLIDRISFSHQTNTYEQGNPILEAVRDGDRLEALGEIGIKRCIDYTKHNTNGRIPEDVIVHCYEKLLRLVPERYISTEHGRKLAIPLHNQIVQYVVDNLSSTDLEYAPPKFL